ncbi:MAG: FAD-dependent oxidoreductase [Chlorobiaceae bacterium]|nr:FAD-dependent oxidoreductase [Chlorobiaceae bacterium]NTV61538.1 FAD-dependent oxidoreductase [Chlorobiaceae bacterium]
MGKELMVSESITFIRAGTARLTAACRFLKPGMEQTVLETSKRFGVRMTTDKRGDYLIDRGASFQLDGYSVIGRLVRVSDFD